MGQGCGGMGRAAVGWEAVEQSWGLAREGFARGGPWRWGLGGSAGVCGATGARCVRGEGRAAGQSCGGTGWWPVGRFCGERAWGSGLWQGGEGLGEIRLWGGGLWGAPAGGRSRGAGLWSSARGCEDEGGSCGAVLAHREEWAVGQWVWGGGMGMGEELGVRTRGKQSSEAVGLECGEMGLLPPFLWLQRVGN